VGISYLLFPLNPVLNYSGGENSFHPFFFFPSLHLVLCNYALDKLDVGFNHLFFFSPLVSFCFVAVLGFFFS
jgi:hypothetical protein